MTDLSNSAARAETLRNAIRSLADIDGQIKELQEERKKIKNTHIKGDLGMKLVDFNVLCRVHSLENEERDVLFDTLREGFTALGINQQSSFLNALVPEPAGAEPAKKTRGKKAKAEPAAPTVEDARNAGYNACATGMGRDDLPEQFAGFTMNEAFHAGWDQREAEHVAGRQPPGIGIDEEAAPGWKDETADDPAETVDA